MTARSAAPAAAPASAAMRHLILVVLGVAALALGWAAWVRNIERACTLDQWPHLTSCPPAPQGVQAQVQRLSARTATNPGDSAAWVELALLVAQNPGQTGLDERAVLAAATRLAGQDRRVQRVQAATALQQRDWPQAAEWLVRLVQDHQDGPSAVALATMLTEPAAAAALQGQLKAGSTWLEPMVNALPQARVPVVSVMPLVVQALPLGLVTGDLSQKLMRQLKAGGQWMEAYALWVRLVAQPVPLLFNGNFEQGFVAEGFDWEITPVAPTRAGARVQQPHVAGHGGVLQVDFTGRPVALPVLRQTLLLLDQEYVFTGQYMGSRLRSAEGLVWTFTCAGDGREVARTPALGDTHGRWQPVRAELNLPPGCGPAVTLQLQTAVPSEALAGLRGQMSFDDFRLEARAGANP